MGDIEFAPSPEQQEIVNRAIEIASSRIGDEFANINPLIAIMQWSQANLPESVREGDTPEARLTAVCRRFIAEHS